MDENELHRQVHPLDRHEGFCFACHAGVPCFTECCRQLDLGLSPYDVLRLKKNLGLTSEQFLERYAVVEQSEDNVFPQVFLAMVDDGRASCPFVGPEGCRVYPDRPGACRLYPVGRGASRQADGSMEEQFVLLQEPHCQGFLQPVDQNVAAWLADQKLQSYLSHNDTLTAIVQHPKIRQGMVPTKKQLDTFLLALYNLDLFRPLALSPEIRDIAEQEGFSAPELADDERLLHFATVWLLRYLFS